MSLSSDGTILAVGAPGNDGNGEDSGHVRVYQYNGVDTWVQLGSDIDGEVYDDTSGYSVSLNSDGTILAVGASGNDGTGDNAGHVRVYEYDGVDTWNQIGSDIDGEAASDQSGASVSLSNNGEIVAVGATRNNGDFSGHVRVYQWNGVNAWVQLGSDIDGEAANDQSGTSVSLNGDGTIVAIGARYNDGTADDAGHVRVYQYNGVNAWVQLGDDIDGEAEDDNSGISVSLSDNGEIVAIGAHQNDGNGADSGHVRVYQYDGVDTWEKVGNDIDGEAAGDESGISVSISNDGTIVAIGASLNDGVNGSNSGQVRVYQYDGVDTWNQLSTDIDGEAAGDLSGISVSISSDGTIVAVGANCNDGNGNNNGHVRVYRYDNGTLSLI